MMIIILLVVISTVAYTLSTLNDTGQQVKQDITDFSRSAYDILIRPADARTEVEKQLNLIEENYLGIGDGGITIAQWQDIKAHPQVEIAAPVASVGLFNSRKRTWMIKRNEEDAIYYEVEYRTGDGLHSYVNIENIYLYDFGNKLREFAIYPSSNEIANNYLGWDIASFDFPLTYHQVVAVDPIEEGKLTNYDLSALSEKVFDDMAYKEGRLSIPIMSLEDVSVPVTIQLITDDLEDLTIGDLTIWENEFLASNEILTLRKNPNLYDQVIDEYISKKRMHQEKVYEFVPDEGHSPFKQNLLYVGDDMKLTLVEDEFMIGIGGAYDYHSQRIGYSLDPVIYQIKEDKTLSVEKIGVDELYQAPIYREIEEIEFYVIEGPDGSYIDINDDDFFGFIENGTFSIVENAESLASAPLGIYGREMPYLASDPSVKMHPSAVPGSFITTPAHGLISIEHAEKAKGEAPIDAIRVKVAGLTGYDSAAATMIRELAQEWIDKGFTVDIVAGASLQDIIVDVEGIGEVVQPFTTLGAADTVLSSWNALQVALTVLYGLVALTFVGFTFFNLLADRRKDEQLLSRFGWSEKLIRRIRYKEWAIMIGIPVVFVIVGFTLLGLLKNHWLSLLFSIGIGAIYVLLFFLANLSQHKQHKQFKKWGKTVTIQNIRFYRFSLLASCIQLFLTTILTCFLPFFLLQNVEKVTQTRLGTYIHGEIEGLFIIVIILLYALSLTTVYQSLSRLWQKRQSEIKLFLYIGWSAKVIRTYFLREVVIWAGSSTVIGWLVSLAITLIFIEITPLMVFASVGGLFLILVITLSSSIYSLHHTQVIGGDSCANQASTSKQSI